MAHLWLLRQEQEDKQYMGMEGPKLAEKTFVTNAHLREEDKDQPD